MQTGLTQLMIGNQHMGIVLYYGGNLVTWHSTKHSVVTSSSAKAKYRAVTCGVCEGIWTRRLMEDLIKHEGHVHLYCDNKSTNNIAHNPIHDRTKHIVEVDRHFSKENLDRGIISID